MQSSASERSAEQASWQWDGEADDAAEAPGDVVGGGGEGPRLSRRRLLAGAGVLAAGGAVWAFTRSGGEQPAPAPSKPQPTALSGPPPVWTYRGPEAMTPERLVGRSTRPIFATSAGLQLLDPATGAPTRMIRLAPPDRKFGSDDLVSARVVISAHRVFTTSHGHVDGRHLTDPAADVTVPLPDALDGDILFTGCDGTTLYGTFYNLPKPGATTMNQQAFALRIADGALLWTSPADRGEQLLTPAADPTGTITALRTADGRTELVVRDAATGRQRWTAEGNENLRWCTIGQRAVYVPDGSGGLRALDLATGTERWKSSPTSPEQWRAMPPVADSGMLYVPRDNGVVSGHDETTGGTIWSLQVPFLLDRRSHPVVVNGVVYVPGPAVGGVCAIDAAKGTLLWTFRDSGPGKDVWSLAADADHLYAGHDDVLHALPLATVF
ncbi:PQQ-binding-like beta-propeller repeat protein [Kitasatospora aureofaciens]|uniref:outer membrane protein assembly factor BamB family protein n=1 Tax=Kitasatospora aureofaciens TaxID=1894 RepID=UPI001C45819C|nr:PQQ-binding-like beta-propeller repeat protein [Kitasatospora aureofaciens]MBV6697707.1 PQQ-binding-like beta-propeller repeat protein [Kitasatospora aureofaciens]